MTLPNEWFLTSFSSNSISPSILSNYHIALVHTDCLVKYSSNNHQTTEIHFNDDNYLSGDFYSHMPIASGQHTPKLVATGVTACSVIIIDDIKNKDIYMIHMMPTLNDSRFQERLGKFFIDKFTENKSLNITAIGKLFLYDINKIVDSKYINKYQKIDFSDQSKVGEVKNFNHKDVWYLPEVGQLIVMPTQNRCPDEIKLLVTPRINSIKSSLSKTSTPAVFFQHDQQQQPGNAIVNKSGSPVCLPTKKL